MSEAEFDRKVREAAAKLEADMRAAWQQKRCGRTTVVVTYQHGAVVTIEVAGSQTFK